jgi:cell division protein ZapA
VPEVNVEINGRKFRMACEEGQEAHLQSLAERFNRHIDAFKGTFGEIGDNRLTVMAGIAVLDELGEAERKIATLERSVTELTEAGEALTQELEELEHKFARRINDASRKLESIATAIDEAGAGPAT